MFAIVAVEGGVENTRTVNVESCVEVSCIGERLRGWILRSYAKSGKIAPICNPKASMEDGKWRHENS